MKDLIHHTFGIFFEEELINKILKFVDNEFTCVFNTYDDYYIDFYVITKDLEINLCCSLKDNILYILIFIYINNKNFINISEENIPHEYFNYIDHIGEIILYMYPTIDKSIIYFINETILKKIKCSKFYLLKYLFCKINNNYNYLADYIFNNLYYIIKYFYDYGLFESNNYIYSLIDESDIILSNGLLLYNPKINTQILIFDNFNCFYKDKPNFDIIQNLLTDIKHIYLYMSEYRFYWMVAVYRYGSNICV